MAAPTVGALTFSRALKVVTLSANIVSSGGPAVTATGFEIGVYSGSYTLAPLVGSQNTGTFSSDVQLAPGTYYARAFATNADGTGYSEEVRFYVYSESTTVADSDEILSQVLESQSNAGYEFQGVSPSTKVGKVLLKYSIGNFESIFKDFKTRVNTNSGIISNENLYLRFLLAMSKVPNALDFLEAHGIILFPEARRMTGSNVNKMYSLFDPIYDVSKSSETAQPALGAPVNGKATILYSHNGGTDRMLEFTGAALDFARNKGYVELFTVAQKPLGINQAYLIYFTQGTNTSLRSALSNSSALDVYNIGNRRVDGDALQTIGFANNGNWQLVRGTLDYANSDAFIYRDGVLQNSTTAFHTAGNTSNTRSVEGGIGGSLTALDRSFKAPIAVAGGWNAIPPAGFVEAFTEFMKTDYALPA